jgi:hypothetical protein
MGKYSKFCIRCRLFFLIYFSNNLKPLLFLKTVLDYCWFNLFHHIFVGSFSKFYLNEQSNLESTLTKKNTASISFYSNINWSESYTCLLDDCKSTKYKKANDQTHTKK